MKDSNHNKKILQSLSTYSQLGVSMVLCVVVGFLIGGFIDSKFSTSPVFLIIFTIMGVIASYRTLFRLSEKEWKKNE